MLRSLFLIVMTSLIVGTGYLLFRNGVFLPVAFSVKNDGPLILLGTAHVGAYHTVLPSLQKVEAFAKENKLPCSTTFGEYLDDPNVVETARLKSFVGCVLTEKPSIPLPEDFRLSERPSRRYLVGTFQGSPALGPYKAYGKAQELMARQNLTADGSVIELYRMEKDGDMTTLYYFPVK
ncbi:MAG TPA: GyrI-like domain-containing protein [Pseudobdellovibrionaceae bacterium]|nr:GyrI-like domain-containing protein [Pseudobdellovibrionaceae bacterium]